MPPFWHSLSILSFVIVLQLMDQTKGYLYKLQQQGRNAEDGASSALLVPGGNADFVHLFFDPPGSKYAFHSVHSLMLVAWLRMAQIPYYAYSNRFLLGSPTGKSPFAQINGEIFSGPEEIIKKTMEMKFMAKWKGKKMYKEEGEKKKSKKEAKLEAALEQLHSILLWDWLAFASTEAYIMDGVEHRIEGDENRLDLWLADEGLREQMATTLFSIQPEPGVEFDSKIATKVAAGGGRPVDTHRVRLDMNRQFMEAYFDAKRHNGEEGKKVAFLEDHGIKGPIGSPVVVEEEEAKDEIVPFEEEEAQDEIVPFSEIMPAKKEKKSEIVPFEEDDEIVPFREIVPVKKAEPEIKMRGARPLEKWRQFDGWMKEKIGKKLEGVVGRIREEATSLKGTLGQREIWMWKEVERRDLFAKLEKVKTWKRDGTKRLGQCEDREILVAFKQILKTIVGLVGKRASRSNPTVNEAFLFAILFHFFDREPTISQLANYLKPKTKVHYVPEFIVSEPSLRAPPLVPVQIEVYEEDAQHLHNFYEDAKKRLNLENLDKMKAWPWPMHNEPIGDKYNGPFPIKTDAMDWLPKLVENARAPGEIKEIPPDMPSQDIMHKIVHKLANHAWEVWKWDALYDVKKGQTWFNKFIGQLMHLAAAYLCQLDTGKGMLGMGKGEWELARKCKEKHWKKVSVMELESIVESARELIYQTIWAEAHRQVERNVENAIGRAMREGHKSDSLLDAI